MLYPRLTTTRCVVDLNGVWDLARERAPGDHRRGFAAEKQVAVPASYNDLFADEAFRMWDKGMWYQRTFVVPRALRGERLILCRTHVSSCGCPAATPRGAAGAPRRRIGSNDPFLTETCLCKWLISAQV